MSPDPEGGRHNKQKQELSEDLTIAHCSSFHAVKKPSSKHIEKKEISDSTQEL